MPAPSPNTDLTRLCVHTATTKPWPIETAIARFAAAGVKGITVWRDAIEGRNLAAIRRQIQENGLETVSLCRGGFFPATSAEGRQQAIDDNRRAIEQAAAIGAPMVVLVCGAALAQSLETSREQIVDGIAAVLPDAEAAGVRLAIEPLHPMYADDRSAINTIAQAHAACDRLGSHPLLGIAVDVYHVWWDDTLPAQIALAGEKGRLFAFHICDWLTPTRHLLTDRGLMGEGCIDIPSIRALVEAAGFRGYNEVEIFSTRWWESDQDEYLEKIVKAYREKS
jgi:sugar phosphate isomerase/epimerase